MWVYFCSYFLVSVWNAFILFVFDSCYYFGYLGCLYFYSALFQACTIFIGNDCSVANC